MAEEESVLIKALPPQSDYMTYLTIVEYNLTAENLPILQKVLQDEKLNANIGWDLIHLLVPLLPASGGCLQAIARLGNPREVILKVTESLRLIDYDIAHPEDVQKSAEIVSSSAVTSREAEQPQALPLPVSQFVVLVSMLQTLHPRIKTKYPSRFLSTTLQAILASFSASYTHREEMIVVVGRLIKSLRGIRRPVLPSRTSSGMIPTKSGPDANLANHPSQNAPDPEAAPVVDTSPGELAMQARLLQSFITHVIEEYLLNLSDIGSADIPGMSWCTRIMERLHPERSIPRVKTMSLKYEGTPELQRRIDAIGQLVNLAKDLNIGSEDLLNASEADESVPSEREKDEEDPPNSVDEIPLSRLGSVLLYTARHVQNILHKLVMPLGPTLEVFPHHYSILKNCLSAQADGGGVLGSEPEALIDAVLALGLVCLETDSIGMPESDEQFNEYLTITALLSSNCPSPNLRGHANYITSTILRSQPDAAVRLAFIRDALENCPFENLKPVAVGWIKGEIIEANPMPVTEHGHHQDQEPPSSIFSTPLALDSIAPFLFPSLQADLISAPTKDAWLTFQTNLSFYLASLNFAYLLLQANHLHENLLISDLWNNNDIAASFLQPLRDARSRFSKALEDGGELHEEEDAEVLGHLQLLEDTLERVTNSVPNLNAS